MAIRFTAKCLPPARRNWPNGCNLPPASLTAITKDPESRSHHQLAVHGLVLAAYLGYRAPAHRGQGRRILFPGATEALLGIQGNSGERRDADSAPGSTAADRHASASGDCELREMWRARARRLSTASKRETPSRSEWFQKGRRAEDSDCAHIRAESGRRSFSTASPRRLRRALRSLGNCSGR